MEVGTRFATALSDAWSASRRPERVRRRPAPDWHPRQATTAPHWREGRRRIPFAAPSQPTALLQDDDVDSNKLLRDRNGALWIGTEQRGLVHVQRGRADTFAKSDGLSGDIICSLFEDREGNIWVSTSAGLDRFRELPVRSYSRKQGLSSDQIASVVAATDGSLWLAAPVGLTRWKDGQTTIFRRTSGLPDDSTQSLFEDSRRRIWVFTKGGLAYSDGSRFVAVPGVPSEEVFSITGDEAGNLWLSGNRGLTHLRSARIVEHFPWSTVRRTQQAKVVLSDKGGVWLSFWNDGGVEVLQGRSTPRLLSVSLTALERESFREFSWTRMGRSGRPRQGGISRIKDGHVATLTSGNGLPCDTIHGTMWDDSGALWAYAACGLFRIGRTELETWIAHPTRRIETTFWDAADGVQLQTAPSSYGPFVARSADGKLWFVGVGRHPGRRPASPFVQYGSTAGPCRASDRGSAKFDRSACPAAPRRRAFDCRRASATCRSTTRRSASSRRKRSASSTAWTGRTATGERSSTSATCSIRTCVQARTGSASSLPTTAVCGMNKATCWSSRSRQRITRPPGSLRSARRVRWACSGLGTGSGSGNCITGSRWRSRRESASAPALRGSCTTRCLQSFHGLLLRFQTVSQLWAERPELAKEKLDGAINEAARAITEGRNAVQGLRESTVGTSDIADAINTLGAELAAARGDRPAPAFHVTVEGEPRAAPSHSPRRHLQDHDGGAPQCLLARRGDGRRG